MNIFSFRKMMLVVMIFATNMSYSQDTDPLRIVETLHIDKSDMMDQCRQTVAQLNDYISYMASKENKDGKQFYKKAALKLFIYDGKPYTEIIERRNSSGNTIRKTQYRQGVTMQVSWVRPNRKVRITPRLMPKYFDGLIDLRYKSVSIETSNVDEMMVGDIYKIADGRYVCTVRFNQKFIGITPEGKQTGDDTRKYVECYIDIKTYLGDPVPIVRLGNIFVEDTKRLY